MTNRTFTPVRGRVMRVTSLDRCGRVKPGPCTSISSEGFVSVGATPRTTEPEEISVTNAAGKKCMSDIPEPKFEGWTLTVSFCDVNPELYAKLTGQPVEYDANGDAVGFRTNSDVDTSLKAFALEVWNDVPGEVCDDNAEGVWGYNLWAFVKGGSFGDFTIENNAVTFSMAGAQTKVGGQWAEGPYDVVLDESDQPAPLAVPWSTGDHFLHRLTSVAPPEPSDCIASGPAPTTATAGTPGTWGPVDSYPEETLVSLQASSVTASPATAWGTGEYMVLGDGTRAHWDGSAWVAGIAP